MNVLSIGTDKKIFEAGSAARMRMIEYGTLFKELHIIIFTLKKQGFKAEKIAENVWIYPTNSLSRFLYPFSAFRLFKKNLKQTAFDVVTAQDPFETGIAARLIARKIKKPLHIQIHTDFLSRYFKKNSPLNWLRVRIAHFILLKASAVRAVSERIRSSLSAISPDLPARTIVLPIYTDMSKFIDGPVSFNLHEKYPQFSFITLMVSRLTPEKNIPTALAIMREVVIKNPKAGLVIVGDGPDKHYLQALALKYHLDRNVIFESWQDELAPYYRSADIFLTTSFYEGYGLTLIEAGASGCPIVSSDVGIAPEIIENGKTGFVCDSVEPQDFTEKIILLMESPALRKTLGDSLRAAVSQKFAQTKESYLASYKTMLEKAALLS